MGELTAYRAMIVHAHTYERLSQTIEKCACGACRWIDFDLPLLRSPTTDSANPPPHAS